MAYCSLMSPHVVDIEMPLAGAALPDTAHSASTRPAPCCSGVKLLRTSAVFFSLIRTNSGNPDSGCVFSISFRTKAATAETCGDAALVPENNPYPPSLVVDDRG